MAYKMKGRLIMRILSDNFISKPLAIIGILGVIGLFISSGSTNVTGKAATKNGDAVSLRGQL